MGLGKKVRVSQPALSKQLVPYITTSLPTETTGPNSHGACISVPILPVKALTINTLPEASKSTKVASLVCSTR